MVYDASADFSPLSWSMAEIRRAIPSHLFYRDTRLAFYYLTRDLALIGALWWLATHIDSPELSGVLAYYLPPHGATLVRYGLWLI